MGESPTSFRSFLDQATIDVRKASDVAPEAPENLPLLNGVPYRLFRQSVDIDERRRAGTFFSGAELSARIVSLLKSQMSDAAIVMDPTCGIGDLLLAYASELPVASTLEETLENWGRRLAGMDLRPELVQMTKARLVMLARSRGRFRDRTRNPDSYFPLISVGDMLNEPEKLAAADGFLFNPPFGRTTEHDVDSWATGKINAAAIFLAKLISSKKSGAPVAAILPEVLRCGSRYEQFRRHLEELGLCGEFSSIGRFDSWTDVDVFVTLLTSGSGMPIWESKQASGLTIGDFFDVKVGPVVPHRHPNKGPWRKFVCAKTTPAWSAGFEPKTSRRFTGTVFQPPFIVIRRTSSPNDRKRAVGAVITGEKAVAVENHLIVLIPKMGGVKTCHKLLGALASDGTNDFLNEHIRCRHLTTGSVRTIPWAVSDA